uniref:Uncharacterized protein n=1 Tax=Arundo donax TaxID=35708 RepID=A0A0A9G8P0_ARUDO
MKGLMNLIKTRKHIRLKVILLKFGVRHQLRLILSGTRTDMLQAPDKVNLRSSRTESSTKMKMVLTGLSYQFWESVALEKQRLQRSCTMTEIS